MKTALLLIDFQNDYFAGGKFPLWNPEAALAAAKEAIASSRKNGDLIVIIQHEAVSAPFFNKDTKGVEVHPELLAAAPEALRLVKRQADAFYETNLEELLSSNGVSELLICGMMTQNCITHTAISKSAEKYKVTINGKACTTVNQLLHLIALRSLSVRVTVIGG